MRWKVGWRNTKVGPADTYLGSQVARLAELLVGPVPHARRGDPAFGALRLAVALGALGALGALAELLAGVDDGLLRPLHRLLECLLVGTGRGELLGEADNLCKQNMTSVQLPVHTLK